MQQCSTRYQQAIQGLIFALLVSEVEVWTPFTAAGPSSFITSLGQNLTGGSVGADATQSVPGSMSAAVAPLGYPLDSLIPRNAGDLLHPATGNLIVIKQGWQYDDGTQELLQLGMFRLTKPATTRSIVSDGASTLAIALQGYDVSGWLSVLPYQDPVPIGVGSALCSSGDVAGTIQALLSSSYPGLRFNLANTSGMPALPPQVLGGYPATATTATVVGSGQSQSVSNPWADSQTMAASTGMELFPDEFWTITMRVPPDPDEGPVVWTFFEGLNSTTSEIVDTKDETEECNGVQVMGIGTGVFSDGVACPQSQSTIWDDDPSSPTWIGGTWAEKPYQYVETAVPWNVSYPSTALAYTAGLNPDGSPMQPGDLVISGLPNGFASAVAGSTGSIAMYDAVEWQSILAVHPDAAAVAGYVDGDYPWPTEAWQSFPNAFHVTITVLGSQIAMVYDIESGDGTIYQAAAWIARRHQISDVIPVIYTSVSNASAIESLVGNGPGGGGALPWLLWSADWTGSAHIDSGACATQWANPGYGSGGNFDVSEVGAGLWFNTDAVATAGGSFVGPGDEGATGVYVAYCAESSNSPGYIRGGIYWGAQQACQANGGDACFQVACGLWPYVVTTFDVPVLTTKSVPGLQRGDIVAVTDTELGITANYAVNGYEWPLAASDPDGSVSLRPQEAVPIPQ